MRGVDVGRGGPGVQVLTWFLSLGLAAPPTVRIVHSGLACNIEEERYSERVYTIREGETLELTCLVTGHPRPQVSPCPCHPRPPAGWFNILLRMRLVWGGRDQCNRLQGVGFAQLLVSYWDVTEETLTVEKFMAFYEWLARYVVSLVVFKRYLDKVLRDSI